MNSKTKIIIAVFIVLILGGLGTYFLISNDITRQYKGLEGIELYNAVMVPKYEGKVHYVVESENLYGEQTIEFWKEKGNQKSIYSDGDESYVTIYNMDKNIIYTYTEGDTTGIYNEADETGNGFRNSITELPEDYVNNMPTSEIIEYNGRDTYHYVIEYSDGNNTNEYWVDLKTKVQVKADFYEGEELISSEEVTILEEKFSEDNLFDPSDDIDFKSFEEVYYVDPEATYE